MTSEEATLDVLENQLPKLKHEMESGRLKVSQIDVFCEKGVYDVDQSERILRGGLALGLSLNFHAEELTALGGTSMGARLGARAISHLEMVTDADVEAMAESKSCAVILPTTAMLLQLPHPPVRKMISAGVRVALGSDFNPNSHCLSMPIVMYLACATLRMTCEEALLAATYHSAYALNCEETHGSIQVGKRADLLILNAPRWEHLIYQFGAQDIISDVIIGGNVVHSNRH